MTDISIPLPVVLLGVITGLTYGLLAVGLVIVYRSNRIINFAHGDIGSFAANVFGVVVFVRHFPYWLVFPAALALGAATGMLVEAIAVRRLRKAPAPMSIIATLGAGTFLVFMSAAVNTQLRRPSAFPLPPGLPSFSVGALLLTPAYVAQLVFNPILVIGLALFLRYSRFGIAIRASADNRDAATTSGISPSRMSSLAWGLAGAISAYTAILQFPAQGFVVGGSLGPGLLLRALFAGVVARLSNLPGALAAGVGLGVVEQILLWNNPSGGQVEAMLFVGTLIALFLIRKQAARENEQGSWLAAIAWRPPPEVLRKLWPVRNLGKIGAALLFAVLLLISLTTNSASFTFTVIAGYTLVGLSVYIVTGLSGQLSLGQFALAGIGGLFSYRLSSNGLDFMVAFIAAGLLTAVVSIGIGLPALRLKGLLLTVSTIAFAVMSEAWLFAQPWAFGEGVDPGRPILAGRALLTAKSYYLFVLPFLALGVWVSWNIARSGLGRSFIAIRDNEDGARALSLHATRLKLQAFGLAGFLAGLGGAVYAHALPRLDGRAFPAVASITVVAMSILGGISLLGGALIGALYLIAFPRFVPLDSAGLAASTLGWLILVLYFPGGLAQILRPLRDRFLNLLGRRAGIGEAVLDEPEDGEEQDVTPHASLTAVDTKARKTLSEEKILEIRDVVKQFGGIKAVDGVSLDVRRGEILGIIGPNGAGKTTLFEIIGGFTKADGGEIVFEGRDVTRLIPERRAELGIVRSFQDARLFPTMTVLDALRLAFERGDRTRAATAILGTPAARRRERERDRRAREVVDVMGLVSYREKPIAELSTGTRRITELACLLAMDPSLLLLDEPSSGIAQRETEVLGDLILQLRSHLDATILVIEHDIPLVTGISDRIFAMDLGQGIALGAPEDVCADPVVIDSYLGIQTEAIERSKRSTIRDGHGSRCAAVTKTGSRCSRPATDGDFCRQHAGLDVPPATSPTAWRR